MARVLPPEEVIDDNYTLLKEREEALMARVIPQEIIFDILSRLPVKPLIRFRCVSKSWCDLFRNPSFIKMQIQHANEKQNSSIIMHEYRLDAFFIFMVYSHEEEIHDPSDTKMMCRYPFRGPESEITVFSCCNGVLCLKVTDHKWHIDYICLWNPITREYNELPRGDFQPDPLDGVDTNVEEIYGFGCDRNLEDYKVVSVTYNHGDNNTEGDLPSSSSQVNVYTVGTDSWRRIEDLPYDLTYEKMPGMYVNGALHWIAYRCCGRKKNENIILSLDLGNEEYGEVPQPVYKARTFEVNVDVLEGCLCIICNVGDGKRVDVWMMKDYGVRESWTKILTISKKTVIRYFTEMIPIKILKNGNILFIDGNENGLLFYDPKKKMVGGNNRFSGWVEAFVGSLVSLKSCRYVRLKKKRKRKRKRKNSDSVNSATSHESESRWWETDEDYDNVFMSDESDDCCHHC